MSTLTHQACLAAAASALKLAGYTERPAKLYAIPRGGVPAAYLLQQLNPELELVENIEDADFLVDDIYDSGATIRRHRLIFGAPRRAITLFRRESAPEDSAVHFGELLADGEWAVFPWESPGVLEDAGDGISTTIRNRIKHAGATFFANDNISEFLWGDDIDILQLEVAGKMQDVLRSLVIDVDNDHNTKGTALRVAKMYLQEVFKGRYQYQPKVTDFPNAKGLQEMYFTGPITIRSTCSHHMVPIMGEAWIGIIPGERVIGLSKFNRLADWICSRPQIQEEMAVQVADVIESLMKPKGLAVVIKATHMCMTYRGVKESSDAAMTTSVMRGTMMEDHAARSEFLSLIKL